MALPQSTKGLRARRYHPPLANLKEKRATVSFSAVFLFSPIPNVFSWVHFQFNCYFVAGINGPSSVRKVITMSACPDNNSGYLDGEDEVFDQEPHELTTDLGITEVQEAVPQEENSIDGIPKNLKNVW